MIQIDSSSLIIYDGSVYGLTVKEKYCPKAKDYPPCVFCEIYEHCPSSDPQLCTIFGATSEDFYVKCGVIECDKETNYIHILPLSGFHFI